jgi:hypothetical protein
MKRKHLMTFTASFPVPPAARPHPLPPAAADRDELPVSRASARYLATSVGLVAVFAAMAAVLPLN